MVRWILDNKKQMLKVIFLTICLMVLLPNIVHASEYEAINVTGFNVDMIPEGSGTVASQADCGFDATGVTFCTDTYASTHEITTGNNFPDNGLITSISPNYNGAIYQLQPYDEKNVLLLFSKMAYDRETGDTSNPRELTNIFSGANATGTLALETSGSYEKLLFFASSAEGTSVFYVTVNFTDGTSVTQSFTVYDWCTGNSSYAARSGMNEIMWAGTSRAANSMLFDCYIDISAHKTKLVKSITFTKAYNDYPITAIFALSGMKSTGAPSEPTMPASNEIIATSTSFLAVWSPVAGATSYMLDVSTDSNFNTFLAGYNNLDVGNVTQKLVTGITPGTTYYYRVRAVNSNGTSFSSETVIAQTINNTVSASPSTITYSSQTTITAVGDNQSAAGTTSGDTKYIPESWVSTDLQSGTISVDGSGDYKVEYTPNATGTQTVTITYQLYTFNGSTWQKNTGSIDTNSVDIVVNALSVDAPTNLIWDSSVFTKATWDDVMNATSYTVQLYKDGSPIVSYSSNDSEYDFVSDITASGTYTFKVTALSTGNYTNSTQSAFSSDLEICSITWDEQSGSGTTGGSLIIVVGETITIPTTDPVRSGYYFNGWFTETNGNGTQVSNLTIAPSGSVSYYAYWIEICTITYDNDGGSGTIASDSGLYNETIMLNNGAAFSKPGYVLEKWDIGELCGMHTLTNSITATAVWVTDSDGDGVSDDDEISSGTNPNNANDVPMQGDITVVVQDNSNTPISGLTIILNSTPLIVTTDAKGSATFRNVKLCPHTIRVLSGTSTLGTYYVNFTEGDKVSTNVSDDASTDSEGTMDTTVTALFRSIEITIWQNDVSQWQIFSTSSTSATVSNPQTGDNTTFLNIFNIAIITAIAALISAIVIFTRAALRKKRLN